MEIGLVRHYKVKNEYPKSFFVSYSELLNWFDAYDNSEIENQNLKLDSEKWNICYSSPSKRAIETARFISKKPIISNQLLELDVTKLLNRRFKLPFIIWAIMLRNKSFSTNESTKLFKNKINTFIDMLIKKHKEEDNILIISHGFVMKYFQKALKRRGFKGDRINFPINGKMYTYKRKKSPNDL